MSHWLVASIALATLIACTSRTTEMRGAPGRGVEQDIEATRDSGPISADPGGARGARSLFGPPESTTAPEPVPQRAPARPSAPSLGIGGLTTEGKAASGNAEVGRRFALDNCRPCHVVAPDQASPVRFANAPDFRAIATAAETTKIGLAVWLTNPHPTMPTLMLTPQEAQDVIAYLESLRGRR